MSNILVFFSPPHYTLSKDLSEEENVIEAAREVGKALTQMVATKHNYHAVEQHSGIK